MLSQANPVTLLLTFVRATSPMEVYHAHHAVLPTGVMKYNLPDETFTITSTTGLLRPFTPTN